MKPIRVSINKCEKCGYEYKRDGGLRYNEGWLPGVCPGCGKNANLYFNRTEVYYVEAESIKPRDYVDPKVKFYPEDFPKVMVMGGLCRSCSNGWDEWHTDAAKLPVCHNCCDYHPVGVHCPESIGCSFYGPGIERPVPPMPEDLKAKVPEYIRRLNLDRVEMEKEPHDIKDYPGVL